MVGERCRRAARQGFALPRRMGSPPRKLRFALAYAPASVIKAGRAPADALEMRLAVRHLVGILLVCSGLIVTVGVFTFARPAYHPRYESKMIDFSHEQYFSPALVRRSFAELGVRLRTVNGLNGFILLLRPGSSGDAKALQVSVAPRNGKGSWGPKLEPYDERFGNVFVTYGGPDSDLLQRVQAAVSSIRNDS
jgi:hypothetical protein